MRLTIYFFLISTLAVSAVQIMSKPLSAQPLLKNATDDTDDTDLVNNLMSAAQDRGMRIIVIDGVKSIGNSNTTNEGRNSAADYPDLMKAQTEFIKFREILKNTYYGLPDSIESAIESIRYKSPSGDLHSFIRALYWSALLLLVGALVERQIYIKRVVERWLAPDLKTNPVGYVDKVPLLVKRGLLKVIGVILSMMVAYVIGSTLFPGTPPESIQYTIAIVYISYAASRLVALVLRMILVPNLNQYRIPRLSDRDASQLYYWLWAVFTFNIVAVMFSVWVDEMGENNAVNAAIASFLGALVALSNIVLVIVNRVPISKAMRSGKKANNTSPMIRLISGAWLPVVIVYFIYSWLEMSFRLVLSKPMSAPLIAGAYVILISIVVVYGLINYFIERIFQREKRYVLMEPELSESEQQKKEQDYLENSAIDNAILVHHPLATFEDLARRISGILSLIVGILALTKIWKIDNSLMHATGARTVVNIVAILFIGYIVYHVVRIWIDHKIHQEGGVVVALGDEGGASGASRLATLLPLFRNFMLAVISMSIAFSALLEVGINVSPLFAGAGVIGLAIGFGAQTLVRDIFSGAFYLFDDAFRRGEYVDIGSVKGTVEKISVRSFQLRHHLGPLHTIPFGEIQHLTNFSRDWVMMKLPLRLTYDTDPERVRKLIKKLGLALMDDPEIGDTFLQPLKSQGVIEMQDSAMIVRVKFMAKPGDQWVIRKRVFQEIRDLFQKEGINFAHREVTVRLAGDVPENLTEQQKQTVAAAALDDDIDDSGSSSVDDR